MITERTFQKYIDNFERINKQDLQKLVRNLCDERNYLFYLLENLNEGVLVVDEYGVVTHVNEGAKQILSKSIRNDAKVPLEQLIDDPELLHLITQQLKEGTRKVNIEQGMIIPQERFLNVNIIPLWNKNDSPKESLVIMADITDKRNLRDEKARAEKIESLIDLTAGIAHEIGNPLNSLNIHLDLLEKDLKPLGLDASSEALKTLLIIREETMRLDKIIKNFLAATRAQKLQVKLVNVNTVIEDVCFFLKPEFEAKKVGLVLSLDEKMQPALFDEERLKQMLINILKNSIEAISEHGLVQIGTYMKDKLICLSVKDDGCGIPEHQVGRIFDAYYTTKKEGAGLGLMIVYNIVRDHGGRIEVRSRKGEGTEFNVLFPLRRDKLTLPEGVRTL
jgi:two-component system, sporulation sensor kinase E